MKTEADLYKGVTKIDGGRFVARRRSKGELYARGPFDFVEEAAWASKMMALAIREGAPVPSTRELRAQMPDLSHGRERPLTMKQKREQLRGQQLTSRPRLRAD